MSLSFMRLLSSHLCLKQALVLLFCLVPVTEAAQALLPTAKIIGGKTSNSTDWPWMSALVLRSDILVFCGASLIDSEWILTAAHCVYNKTASDLEVLINQPNLLKNTGERIAVKEIIIHPAFKRTTLLNDIALLHLASPSITKPVEIISENSALDSPTDDSIALGWGNTSTYRQIFPDNLQEVSLPIVSNSACKAHMTGIEDSMLCAGPEEGGKDTCEGDSGGPLVVFDPKTLAWQQVGITSFGLSSCASSGKYGVYTRLKIYQAFITDTLCTPDKIPAAPVLNLSLYYNLVFATWNTPAGATSYTLSYAPYPSGLPINSFPPMQRNLYFTSVDQGAAYYVAVTAHQGKCHSKLSNIEHFIFP